jgi:hypothetical protein
MSERCTFMATYQIAPFWQGLTACPQVGSAHSDRMRTRPEPVEGLADDRERRHCGQVAAGSKLMIVCAGAVGIVGRR